MEPTMSDKESNLGRDLTGIALFVAAALLGVSAVMGWLNGASPVVPSGVTPFDMALIHFLGRPACFWIAIGLAWVGGRMWLSGSTAGLWRHLGGILGSGLGLSVLMSALAPAYGGWWGYQVGGWTAANLSKLLAVPLGILCTFVPVWFAWLRPRGPSAWDHIREADPSVDRSAESHVGVSPEEAAELIPRKVVRTGPAALAVAAPSSNPAVPADIRKPLSIPAGAKPFDPTHVQDAPQSESRAAPMPQRPAQGPAAAGHSAGADLARDAAVSGEARGGATVRPVEERPRPLVPLGDAPTAIRPVPIQPAPVRPIAVQPPSSPEAADVESLAIEEPVEADELETPPALPIASWEQPDLFEEDVPVDAYGTPIALVESLRAESPDREDAAVVEDDEELAEASAADDEEDEQEFTLAEELEDEEAEDDVEELEEEPAIAVAESEEPEVEEREEEPVEELRAPAPESVAQHRQAPLFENLAPAAPAEREVVLQPQAAPVAQTETGPIAEEDELVYKAGLMILERQRVAVSMLQREFGLDFEQATALLDRLQQAGLIGPYLGGQRRDILLDLDQWRGRMLAR